MLSGSGIVAAVLVWRLIAASIPLDPDAANLAARLGSAVMALLPGVFVLSAMILTQIGARFISGAIDPLAGGETRFLRVNQRVITNTVEQFVVFIAVLPALAAEVSSRRMPYVLALGPVFALARLAFWAGYLAAPVARAPGMAATGAVNAAALFAAAWIALIGPF